MAKCAGRAKHLLVAAPVFTNLGLWRPGARYPEAAEALARAVGEAGRIAPDDRVLELACGAGAGLPLWRTLGAGAVLGIDPGSLDAARRVSAGLDGVEVRSGRAEDADHFGAFDVVLAVDAAYHFDAAVWLGAAGRALAPGGRLAFTDLVLDGRLGVGGRVGARLCRFGRGAPRRADRLQEDLREAGLELEAVEDLTQAVLEGFSAWAAAGPHADGPPVPRLAITITAALARRARAQAWARYVLVRARKRSATREALTTAASSSGKPSVA